MAIASVYNAGKQARRPLTDDEVVGVLAREVKTRRESIEAFDKAGRTELAEKERKEAEIPGEFALALSEDELQRAGPAAIAQTAPRRRATWAR